ncbi:MAG TPA: c-type cytochrome [Longimicrobiaceae bacterium]|nr:c-type cytochrome [Longimicrobiaceae bacterium]
MTTSRLPGTIPALALLLLLALAGCERERRSFRETPPGATAFPAVQTSELQAGPRTVDPAVGAYQENRWAVGQGYTFYVQYNCAGCHAPGGGGGMGPPLNDDEWIYGSDPENVFATIVEGRPNGMPSFRGRIDDAQLWQLVAYVRSMSGLTPRDTWPARADHMQETRPEREPRPQWQLP